MNENDFELELNLNEKKKLINNNKEYQKKIKNSKGRHNLQNIINQKNINLKEIFSSPTNKKRIREKDEEENIKNIEKKKKIKPIRQMMERIHLDKNYNYSLLNQKEIKKRKLRIFGDMSSSEISQNLFKNYYHCIIPSYYPNQIKTQIISSQINKITKNFEAIRKLKENEITKKLTQNEIRILEKLKLNHNPIELKNNINKSNNNYTNNNNYIIPNYLKEYAENNGEWINENEYYDGIERLEESNEYEDDSNNENNSINTYPEEEKSDNFSSNTDDIVNNENDDDNYNDYINDNDYNNNL
jgi:hypothetical protein